MRRSRLCHNSIDKDAVGVTAQECSQRGEGISRSGEAGFLWYVSNSLRVDPVGSTVVIVGYVSGLVYFRIILQFPHLR